MWISLSKTLTFVALFLLFIQSMVHAQNHIVYLAGEGVPESEAAYNERVDQIRPGSTVVFQKNGFEKSFRVGQLLGRGHTTAIFELLDHPSWVLRVPRIDPRSEVSKGVYERGDWINKTFDGYKLLVQEGLPVVRIHEYQKDLYVIVDRVSGFTFQDFLFNTEKLNLSEYQVKSIERQLFDFVMKVSRFETIGDFHAAQIIYDKTRGWTIIDWTAESSLYKGHGESPFDFVSRYLLLELFDLKSEKGRWQRRVTVEILERIQQVRDSLAKNSCQKLFN